MCFFKRRKNFNFLSTKAQNLLLKGEWAALQEYIELIRRDIITREKKLIKEQKELNEIKKLYEELTEVNTKH